jgi:hypothetical protein
LTGGEAALSCPTNQGEQHAFHQTPEAGQPQAIRADGRAMKTFTGYRVRDEHGHPVRTVVKVHEEGQEPRDLPLCDELRLHSAEFNWGYAGSGPAQLSLALAFEVLGNDEAAQDVYQQLKRTVVGRLPEDGWTLSEEQLRRVIREIQQERDQDQSRYL